MKKTTRKKVVVSLIGAVLLLSAFGLMAAKKYKEMTPEEIVAMIAERISDKLDLDAEQEEKMHAVIDEIKATRDVVHKDKEADRRRVIEELRSEAIDQELIMDIFTERQDAIEQRLPKILAKFADFHNSLSDEQKEEIIERLEEKHSRWH
jgi:Spy/CpxP family protein refolding chaperone